MRLHNVRKLGGIPVRLRTASARKTSQPSSSESRRTFGTHVPPSPKPSTSSPNSSAGSSSSSTPTAPFPAELQASSSLTSIPTRLSAAMSASASLARMLGTGELLDDA